MIVETFDRGNAIEFTATFTDADGEAVTPDSATVKVNFLNSDSERETETVMMNEQSDGSWFGIWDSSDALPARVDWSMQSANPASVKDGSFDLEANRANLAAD